MTAAPTGLLCNPLLLTDGSVMIHECFTPNWFKLTPDASGNYASGTWSQLASLPDINGVQYAPDAFASAVLPDGRVIVTGGEYNGTDLVWTNLGAIYDPLADSWTPVLSPIGWQTIGDAPSVVLADGTFLLGNCCASPALDALFDEETLNWFGTGAPTGGNYQNEQGYTLLPNGYVLTVDIWTNSLNVSPQNAERYNPLTGLWTEAGTTPVSLPDPVACGTFEIGPAVLRGDGTVVAFGGHTCGGPDPTAIYDVSSNTWSAGPNLPSVCGVQGVTVTDCSLADAPAALLPDGNILFAADAGIAFAPTHFFEFTRDNTIQQVADPLSNGRVAFHYNLLVLPNGQIFMTDDSNVPQVYTPAGSPVARWRPRITHVAEILRRDCSYQLSGEQLNGVSAGAYYGDNVQGATNYPIVRLTNDASGDVAYARTFDHSSMGVTPGAKSDTHFALPGSVESGPSSLVVIANGIASEPRRVKVLDDHDNRAPDSQRVSPGSNGGAMACGQSAAN